MLLGPPWAVHVKLTAELKLVRTAGECYNTVQQVLSAMPNFYEAFILLPSSNICEYYICEAILRISPLKI